MWFYSGWLEIESLLTSLADPSQLKRALSWLCDLVFFMSEGKSDMVWSIFEFL
jgi:hypothetical protein